MTRFASPDLDRAFCDGERFGDGRIRVVEAGDVVLPTGRIVACDPGYLLGCHRDETAFTRRVPPGRYPVSIALLSWPRVPKEYPNHWRVACAMVRFTDRPVERWEMALRKGWDPSKLRPGYHHGYGVDGGRGCFMDESAKKALPADQKAFFTALERTSREGWEAHQRYTADPSEANQQAVGRAYVTRMQEAYRLVVPPALGEMLCPGTDPAAWHPSATRSAVLDPASGANVVSFTSGEGDGCYASYFGLSADGSAARLVTDFGLLVRPVQGTLKLPVPAERRAALTHPELAETGANGCQFEYDPATGDVVVALVGKDHYVHDVRLETRPGKAARLTMTSGNNAWHFQVDRPLTAKARVVIQYTARIEAL
jgi:hypothetical protein